MEPAVSVGGLVVVYDAAHSTDMERNRNTQKGEQARYYF